MNQQLYDQLVEAGKVLVQREETEETIRIYADKIEEQNNTLEKARKDIKKLPKFYVLRLALGLVFLWFGGIITLAFGMGVLMCLFGTLIWIPLGLLLFLAGILIPGMQSFIVAPFALIPMAIATIIMVVFLLMPLIVDAVGISLIISIPVSKKQHTKKATAKYEKLKVDFEEKNKILEDEINRLKEELDAFLGENGKYIEFLPVDYQTVHAVCFMLKSVKNLRADTLKEAINLYDQELKHLEAMAAAERQRLQNENMLYAMELLNMNMEHMNEKQARTNQILRSIDTIQTINMAHHW